MKNKIQKEDGIFLVKLLFCDNDHFARLYGEADVFQHLYGAEGLTDIFRFNDRHSRIPPYS